MALSARAILLTMDALALSLAQQRSEPKTAALALLALGKDLEASALLEAWQPREGVGEAERLALLSFAAFRRGDAGAYRRLALQAARQAQTPLTLYHLGLSLPPKDGLVALQEGLHQLEAQSAPPKEQARLAYALARTLRRLGRWGEALAHASLAVLQAPGHPHYQMEELTLLALAGEEPLSTLERSLPPLLAHEAPGVRYYALWLSLLLQGMQGQASPKLLQTLLSQNPSPHQPYDLPLIVLLFKHHPSSPPLLSRWLRAAAIRLTQAPLPQALLSLAQGLHRYPHPDARPLLEGSIPTLEAEWAEEALRAVAHLSALEGASFPEPYRQMAQALRPQARALFLPAELPQPSSNPYLQALGKAQLQGFPALRPRSLELLVLLLAHPEGIGGEKLARALYPEPNPQALKSELCRLRQQGFLIQSRPYRLLTPMRADFLELEEALQKGHLSQALALYWGPLLPKSQAPGIELLRNQLEERLKRAVVKQPGPEALYLLAQRIPDDLTLWEALLARLPEPDPRRPAVLAWVRRLSAQYH